MLILILMHLKWLFQLKALFPKKNCNPKQNCTEINYTLLDFPVNSTSPLVSMYYV